MTFEQFIKSAFISHVLAPKKRKYVTINAAEYLINETFSYEDTIKQSRMMTPKEKQKSHAIYINSNLNKS